MFSNYFKLAIKVLGRRKFFTFISLFGISFTLMVLMLMTSFLQTELGKNKPLTEKQRMVFMDRCNIAFIQQDTIYEIDSALVEGTMVYDTLDTRIEDNETSSSMSAVGYKLLDEHLRDLEMAEDYTFFSPNTTYDLFVSNKKLTLNAVHTDAGYWRIFDFEFVEGQPYLQQQVDNQELVAIINTETREAYFGTDNDVVGKEIELDRKHFKVIGVVEKPTSSIGFLNGDVYLPLTHLSSETLASTDLTGDFLATFTTETPTKRQELKDEIKQLAANYQMPNPEDYNHLFIVGKTFEDMYATQLIQNDREPEQSTKTMTWILFSLLSLFVLIPTLNLININLSRILERSDEIGVRKAFGATSNNILTQFVFENVILTLVGGLIGFTLAIISFNILNGSKALGDVILKFNVKIAIISLLITIIFGVLSGIIPALRMSKVHIINALKQNQQ